MQTSNQPDYLPPEYEMEQPHKIDPPVKEHVQGLIFILVVLLIFAVLTIWIMQNSVNAYFQQTYHRESPFTVLDQIPAWKKGGEIGVMLYAQRDHLKDIVVDYNQQVIDRFNDEYAYTTEHKQMLAEKARLEKIRLEKEAAERAHQELLNQFSLTKTNQVFFAGDSLMQGVAPYVQKSLKENYDIKTVNLSRQSTGLSYPSFFNWPQTIEETLKNNKDIKVLVVFLGPNDPWDMPNPKGGQYLKFKSAEWEAEYRARIAKIIQVAQQHNVSVMWLTPPNMRKNSLNEQMMYLNHVIQHEVEKNKAFAIDSRPLLGGVNGVYSDYLKENEKSIKMRSADGIHFSSEGQKAIANVIAAHLTVLQ